MNPSINAPTIWNGLAEAIYLKDSPAAVELPQRRKRSLRVVRQTLSLHFEQTWVLALCFCLNS